MALSQMAYPQGAFNTITQPWNYLSPTPTKSLSGAPTPTKTGSMYGQAVGSPLDPYLNNPDYIKASGDWDAYTATLPHPKHRGAFGLGSAFDNLLLAAPVFAPAMFGAGAGGAASGTAPGWVSGFDLPMGAASGGGGGSLAGTLPYVGAGGTLAGGAGLTDAEAAAWVNSGALPGGTNLGVGLPGTAGAGGLAGLMGGSGGTLPQWLGLGGNLAGLGLGIAGSLDLQGDLQDIASRYEGFGYTSRQRYEASYQPGFSMLNEPGYKDALDQTTKAMLRGLSVSGNPANNPRAWDETLSNVNAKFAYPALQNYRNQNAATGGYGAYNTATPGLQSGAAMAGNNLYNAIGSGISNLTNPMPSNMDQYRMLSRLLATGLA